MRVARKSIMASRFYGRCVIFEFIGGELWTWIDRSWAMGRSTRNPKGSFTCQKLNAVEYS
jgi:hypothetical protein